jgi:hypothetical protein
MKMLELEIEAVSIAQSVEIAQQLQALQTASPQQLESRVAAAIGEKLDGMRQDVRAAVLQSEQATDRLIDMALNAVLGEMLDPTRQVTAGGLDETQAAALNDVTKSLAEEQGLRDWRAAEITRQGTDALSNCQNAVTTYSYQMILRQEQLKQLGVDGTVELIRSLSASPSEQWRAVVNDLNACTAPRETEKAVVEGLNRPGLSTVQDLQDQIARTGVALAQLKREQEAAFDWGRTGAIMQCEQERNALVFDARLALGLLQSQAGASETAERARTSPTVDAPLVPGSAGFDLLAKEVFDAAKSAALNLSSLSEAVAHHAEGRLSTVYAVLDQIVGAKREALIDKNEPVFVGGPAVYQLGTGSRADQTEAAHELPAQIYIGIDEAQFRCKSADERSGFRLDSRITDDRDLAALARFQAAATNVLPAVVNDVDGLWEGRGLRQALQTAIEELIKHDAANRQTLDEAYETFRVAAGEALDSARDYYLSAKPSDDVRAELAVVELYRQTLEQIDAARARDLMFDWIERSQRFSKGPEHGSG